MRYRFDPNTYEYLDSYPDGDNAPPNVTPIEPPEVDGAHQVPVFSKKEQGWTIEADYRGTEYWQKDGTHTIINAIGVILPKGALHEAPDLRSLSEVKQDTLATIAQMHATALRSLTGNATPEERDTWQAKALAAKAISLNNASPEQVDMIATEAALVGEETDDLVQKIITKYVRFQNLIGLAAGLKRKAEKAAESARSRNQIGKALDDFEEAIATQLTGGSDA